MKSNVHTLTDSDVQALAIVEVLMHAKTRTVTFDGTVHGSIDYCRSTLDNVMHEWRYKLVDSPKHAPYRLLAGGKRGDCVTLAAAWLRDLQNAQCVIARSRTTIVLYADETKIAYILDKFLYVRGSNRFHRGQWENRAQINLDFEARTDEEKTGYCHAKALDTRFSHFVSARVEGFAQGFRTK